MATGRQDPIPGSGKLAAKLEREHSFVSRIELGDRRVDVVEFFWICRACGKNPATVAPALMREFGRIEPSRKGKARAKKRQKRG